MASIAIDPRHLKGALVCAAVKDIRHYLNGVLLDIKPRETRTVGCDGHRLVCIRREVPDNEPDQVPAQIIIPSDVIKALKPGRSALPLCALAYGDDMARTPLADCTLSALAGGTSVTFKPVDGKFPDYERVISRETPSMEHGHFCLRYLADMTKAAHVAFDEGRLDAEIWPNGTGSASVTYPGHPEFFGVVMGLRGSASFELPEWLKPSMPCEEPRKLRAVKEAA
jgi:DNA polymerase-3 subunit beta